MNTEKITFEVTIDITVGEGVTLEEARARTRYDLVEACYAIYGYNEDQHIAEYNNFEVGE